MSSSLVKVYSSKGAYSKGIGSIIKKMFLEVVESRELAWQLFMRDFKGKYKQSLLGWLWVILSPLIAVGTFFVLNKSGVMRVGNIEAPYVLSGGATQIIPLACRESALDAGFYVYMSVDDGASYNMIATSTNLQPYGTLQADYNITYTIDEITG